MSRVNWTPEPCGRYRLRVCDDRYELVSETQLDAIRAGQAAARFYSEYVAALDIPYDQDARRRGGKTSRPLLKRRAGRTSAQPAPGTAVQDRLLT